MFTTRVFRVLQGFNFRVCHSFAKLSVQAQKAVWSCRIIKEISEAQENADYFEVIDGKKTLKPSLADKIKNLKISQIGCQEDELDEDIRKQVVNMFIKGVDLNYKVYDQKRIRDGAKINQLQSKRPFVFYPNSLVTKFMFNIISFQQMPDQKRFLLYGNYGISKTVAIVLYHLLSSLVNQFFYKAPSDSRQMEELNSLLKRNLIKKVPKIFYYSSNVDLSQAGFLKSIKQQCNEINQIKQDYQKLQKIKSNQLIKIKQLYQNRGIQTVAIFDQLNAVASILRKYNTELKEKKLTEKEFQHLKRQLELAKQQIQRIKQLQQLCNHIFFNSSADIEIELFRKQADPSPNRQYTLDFNKHSNIQYGKLTYNKFLFQPWGQVSFSHCVWSQIQRKLVSLSIPSQGIQRMKVVYFQKLESTNHRWPNYMRFLNVRQSIFPDQNEPKSSLEEVNESNYYRKLDEGIDQILEKGLSTILNTLTLFMQKGSIGDKQRRFNMITSLFEFVSNISEEIPQNSQPLRIPLKDFQSKLRLSVKLFLQEQKNGFQLLPLFIEGREEEKVAVFLYTPAEFKRLYSHLILNFTKIQISILQKYQKYFLWNPSALGKWVQFTLLLIIMKKDAQISFSVQRLEKTLPMNITVSSVQKFLHFNGQKETKIWNNFQPLLRAASENNGRDVIGVPVTVSKIVEESSAFGVMSVSYNSKCFDAAMVKCVNNFFHIDTFDFTTEKQIGNLKKRVREAAELLEQITKDEDTDSLQSTGIVFPQDKNDTKKDHTTDDKATFKQDQLIAQKYPTFRQIKQNKNFKVRHIIVLPKQSLAIAIQSQIKDVLLSVQKITKLVNQNQQKEADKNKKQIKGPPKYKGKYWQIWFAALEDIKAQNYQAKEEQSLYMGALNTLHLKK